MSFSHAGAAGCPCATSYVLPVSSGHRCAGNRSHATGKLWPCQCCQLPVRYRRALVVTRCRAAGSTQRWGPPQGVPGWERGVRLWGWLWAAPWHGNTQRISHPPTPIYIEMEKVILESGCSWTPPGWLGAAMGASPAAQVVCFALIARRRIGQTDGQPLRHVLQLARPPRCAKLRQPASAPSR